MRRLSFLTFLAFMALIGFTGNAQDAGQRGDNRNALIIGGVPDYADDHLYQIQVGAFQNPANAERAFGTLQTARLSPSRENFENFTRVVINQVRPKEVPFYREKLKSLGFSEILIRRAIAPEAPPPPVEPPPPEPIAEAPVSDAVLPPQALREIGSLSARLHQSVSLSELAEGRDQLYWRNSTPEVMSVDSNGVVTGLALGNGYVQINDQEFIAVAVVPEEDFYFVPRSQESMLPPESAAANSGTSALLEYRTEPTFRLAWRYNNKGERRGASGGNGGIDILGRGANYQWLWTTYQQGGWFYDLNGVKRQMIDGYQKDANGVELTVLPEFVYEKGVPYLQLRQQLRNSSDVPVTGQRFGASADVMIHNNDHASLLHKPYGAYMADSQENPSLELMFVGESGYGITPVDTLWLGAYNNGAHLENIYNIQREDVSRVDSAIGFSYGNIDLAPGETKEYIVRFTLARVNGE